MLFKKTSCFALLLTWLLPFLLIGVFHVQKTRITEQMERRLEAESLQQLILPASRVHWVKPGKEIVVQGKMFDIRSLQRNGDFYHFVGLFDEEESGLLGQMAASRTASGILMIHLLSLFQTTCPPAPAELSMQVDIQITPVTWSAALSVRAPAVLTPPPRVA